MPCRAMFWSTSTASFGGPTLNRLTAVAASSGLRNSLAARLVGVAVDASASAGLGWLSISARSSGL